MNKNNTYTLHKNESKVTVTERRKSYNKIHKLIQKKMKTRAVFTDFQTN